MAGQYFSVQHQAKEGSAAGILASIREAAIRVAIQAHLPEEARRRQGREQIYEQRRYKGRGGACSQSVTEIERESKEGGTGTERGEHRAPREEMGTEH